MDTTQTNLDQLAKSPAVTFLQVSLDQDTELDPTSIHWAKYRKKGPQKLTLVVEMVSVDGQLMRTEIEADVTSGIRSVKQADELDQRYATVVRKAGVDREKARMDLGV